MAYNSLIQAFKLYNTMKKVKTLTGFDFKNLTKGKHYLVKHSKGDKHVRRFFKGTEERFGEILCYVFSSQVSPKTDVEYNEEDETFTMRSPFGVRTPSMEITIPFYDLVDIKEII